MIQELIAQAEHVYIGNSKREGCRFIEESLLKYFPCDNINIDVFRVMELQN